MCNGGKNPLYEIRPEPDGSFKVSLYSTATCARVPFSSLQSRQLNHLLNECSCDYNCNFAAFGQGQYSRFMVSGGDWCPFPVFFEVLRLLYR